MAARQPAVGPQTCSLILTQNHSSMCPGSTEPQPWSDMGNGDWERVNDSPLRFIFQNQNLLEYLSKFI